jgi:inner membrane protein
MASIGHVAVGLAAGRLYAGSGSSARLAGAMAVFSALSLLPDADVVGFAFGVRYSAPFGHRGASHSLACAALVGLLAGLAASRFGESNRRSRAFVRAALYSTAVVASHGLLDMLTDGGLGVALLWPLSTERFFAPWRPIPVAPIGMGFFSARGMRVAAAELVYSVPLAVYALWPAPAPRRRE